MALGVNDIAAPGTKANEPHVHCCVQLVCWNLDSKEGACELIPAKQVFKGSQWDGSADDILDECRASYQELKYRMFLSGFKEGKFPHCLKKKNERG